MGKERVKVAGVSRVERVLEMVKRLTASELVELSKKLEAYPNWPGKAGAPVGAKPKSGPPSMSAAAEREIPEER